MAVIINVCVDPRLNHEVIRAQVQSKLERLQLSSKRLFITSDIGGNIGSSFASTAQVALAGNDDVVLAAVLHHDDCIAAQQNRRQTLAVSGESARKALESLGISAPVLPGTLRTEDSTLTWSDEPAPPYEVFNFRMPRL